MVCWKGEACFGVAMKCLGNGGVFIILGMDVDTEARWVWRSAVECC